MHNGIRWIALAIIYICAAHASHSWLFLFLLLVFHFHPHFSRSLYCVIGRVDFFLFLLHFHFYFFCRQLPIWFRLNRTGTDRISIFLSILPSLQQSDFWLKENKNHHICSFVHRSKPNNNNNGFCIRHKNNGGSHTIRNGLMCLGFDINRKRNEIQHTTFPRSVA